MAHSLFLRQLFWKEYRQQRGFWIASVIFGAVLQLWIIAAASFNGRLPNLDALIGIALVMPCVFALGSGATLFAGEHDAGTYESLRALPVSSGQVLFNKVTCALVGLVIIPVPLALTGLLGSWWWTMRWSLELDFWPVAVLIALELFAWGMFFSLQLKRPLWSVVLSAGAVFVTALLIAMAVSVYVDRPNVITQKHWSVNSLWQFALHGVAIVLILLDDLRLANGWLNKAPRRVRRLTQPLVAPAKPLLEPFEVPAYSNTRIYVRLMWQEWKRSWGSIAGIFAVFGFWSLGLLFIAARSSDVALMYLAIWSLPLSAGVLGGCVFLGDQTQNSHRFFAERGINARHVWLSRHAVWGFPLCVWLTICVTLPLVMSGPSTSSVLLSAPFFLQTRIILNAPVLLELLGTIWILSLASYGAAQIGSLSFRSGIVGLFAGLFLSLLVCIWAFLMSVARASWLWSVVPLCPLFLWATWLRAPDWMIERTTWRAKLRAIAVAIAPLMMISAFIVHRVVEVPRVDLPTDGSRSISPSPEALLTAEMYREAIQGLIAPPVDAESRRDAGGMAGGSMEPIVGMSGSSLATESAVTVPVEPTTDQLQALRTFLHASQREECHFDRRAGQADFTQIQLVVFHLLQHAARLEEAQEQEAALELAFAMLRFARHLSQANSIPLQLSGDYTEEQALTWIVGSCERNQNTFRIGEVIERLQRECFDHKPARDLAILEEYRAVSAKIALALPMMGGAEREFRLYHNYLYYLPWEPVRLRRLAAFHTRVALDELRRVQGVDPIANSLTDVSDRYRLERQMERSLYLREMLTDPLAQAMAATKQDMVRRDIVAQLGTLTTRESTARP